ncbi:MAG TPA: DUF2480 family protein [Pseudosphingobacterium sp.]|nr:DUF2480 family protein [Pseudosphingobacterium sp.]
MNKIVATGIISIDLIAYQQRLRFEMLDLAPYLYKGMIIKEKEVSALLINNKVLSLLHGESGIPKVIYKQIDKS